MEFDLFVGVTVLPVWRRPPRSPREALERAGLAAEFLEASRRLAAELKHQVLQHGARQGEQPDGR